MKAEVTDSILDEKMEGWMVESYEYAEAFIEKPYLSALVEGGAPVGVHVAFGIAVEDEDTDAAAGEEVPPHNQPRSRPE